MARGKREELFSPVPMRAFADTRLHGVHCRVLMFIAGHDRFGANGIGCFANQRRMAEQVGTEYTRLNKTLRDLARWGYITGKPHDLNKRLRVYSVLYTEEDRAVTKGEKLGGEAKDAGQTIGADANQEPETLGTEKSQASDSFEKSDTNIFCEAENISGETVEDIPLKGRAPRRAVASKGSEKSWDEGEQSIGERLRRLEAHLRRSDPIDLQAAYQWLEAMADEPERFGLDMDAPEGNWVSRLFEWISGELVEP